MLVISYGVEIRQVAEAVKLLDRKPTVIKINRIYPLGDALVKLAGMYPKIFIYEEGYRYGGVGSMLCQKLTEAGYKGDLSVCGIPPEFVRHATIAETLAEYGLDASSIHEDLKRYYDKKGENGR